MSDVDRVFARFSAPARAETPRRQTVTVPGRGTRGSRVVEVVHLRHGSGAADEAPARHAADIGASAWGNEIAARRPSVAAAVPKPATPSPLPVVHVMPAWQPKPVEVEALPAAAIDEHVSSPEPRPTNRLPPGTSPRRVADPFDAKDDGANCIRCGYAVEQAREKRGLLTCAGCG